MYYSKYNMVFPLKAGDYVVMNPLAGSVDLATSEEVEKLASIKEKGLVPTNLNLVSHLLQRGYLFENESDEERMLVSKKAEFDAITMETSKQLILIPTYSCNLACSYCFQQGVEKSQLITKETVDAFFDFAGRNFDMELQKPFVTLFGGEPLIYSPAQAEIINYIIDQCNQKGYQLAVVTNGYNLEEYVDILARADIREIQVTVDGPPEIHDTRRGRADGQGTFHKIISGLEKIIDRGMPVNFRAVVDQSNLKALVPLAEIIKEKGWLALPPEKFKTQVGRNYELFECYAKPEHLLGQVELWAGIARLSAEYPVLKEFHQPEFKGIKHLVKTGEMYLASFDTCPAFKTEWVFDLYGKIYGCTASCGRNEYDAGTYYPKVNMKDDIISDWQGRNIVSIPECRDCQVGLICGGGCGVVAHNKTGQVRTPDCRPVKDILDLGIKYYQEEILNL